MVDKINEMFNMFDKIIYFSKKKKSEIVTSSRTSHKTKIKKYSILFYVHRLRRYFSVREILQQTCKSSGDTLYCVHASRRVYRARVYNL